MNNRYYKIDSDGKKQKGNWFSLYNNSFPGKINPSVHSAILLFVSFVLLGQLNTSSTVGTASSLKKSNDNSGFQLTQSVQNSATNQIIKKSFTPLNIIKQNKVTKNRLLLLSSIVSKKTINPFISNKFSIERNNPLAFIENVIHKKTLQNHTNLPLGHPNNISFQVYASSSFDYQNAQNNQSNFSNTSGLKSDINELTFSIKKTSDIEAGGAFLFNLSKIFTLKAGMQFNYTHYEIEDLKNTISQNNTVTEPGESPSHNLVYQEHPPYSQKINTRSYQISIPIGGEIKIARVNDLEWVAGATVQPSFLIAGNDDLENEQLKNATDIGTIRSWNINTNLETYFSYHLKNGLRINAGPQLKYQMFPTLLSKYLYSERLYNLGLKVGLTKSF